jgi:hypothetical protein
MCEKSDIHRITCERIINQSWASADENFEDFKRISKHGIKDERDKCLGQVAAALVAQQMIFNHAQNKLVGLTNEVDEIEDPVDEIVE